MEVRTEVKAPPRAISTAWDVKATRATTGVKVRTLTEKDPRTPQLTSPGPGVNKVVKEALCPFLKGIAINVKAKAISPGIALKAPMR